MRFPNFNIFIYSILILLAWGFVSCYNDNEEYLYQHLTDQTCDTVNVTFSGTILPIMNQYCVKCHSTASPSAGISLDNYAGVSAVAATGQLWGSVSWTGNFSAMPQGENQLSPCNLSKIRAWLNKAYPND
ncbi:MAG TPA: hypothetical protein P5531_00830 [Bacteroidales bacterium]|nr:hypothetical protein [Bacteroidales bacterium]HSA42200.1 hypothetical protein [Bacteroidales bacterium]